MELKEFNPAKRYIYINGEVTDESALLLQQDVDGIIGSDTEINRLNAIAVKTVYGEKATIKSPVPPVNIKINTPGGMVFAGLLMYDTLKRLSDYTETTITASGLIASAGVYLFLGVPLRNRKCTKNTNFLIHQVSSGTFGTTKDIIDEAAFLEKLNAQCMDIIVNNTSIPRERIDEVVEKKQDWWLTPEEAKEYGIISAII